MTTPPLTTITDEVLAELEQLARKSESAGEDWVSYADLAGTLANQCDIDYIVEASPATILSLIKHIRSLKTELSGFKASDAQAIRWLAEIRSACGATHGMTFLEMVEHMRELRADSARYQLVRSGTDFDTWQALAAAQPDEWDAILDAARSSTTG